MRPFPGNDLPVAPAEPRGELTNTVLTDRAGRLRAGQDLPGALSASVSEMPVMVPGGMGVPLAGFDYNGNGRIDFNDVVMLFNAL